MAGTTAGCCSERLRQVYAGCQACFISGFPYCLSYGAATIGVTIDWLRTCRRPAAIGGRSNAARSEEHTSELQSLMRISYAVFCLQKKKNHTTNNHNIST